MVFSSIPPYADTSNWQQPLNHQGGSSGGSGSGSSQLPPPLAPPPQTHGGSTIRPSSMAERARFANIQMPEGPLKCPRCESTNTKFCYFNNYSLSQPRHFCKMCRRYWTQGGALRNIPVGGGCRRNKRSKGSCSKSSSSAGSDRPAGSNSGGGCGRVRASSGMSSSGGLVSTSHMLGFGEAQNPSWRLMSSLQCLNTSFGSSLDQMGLHYNRMPPPLGEAGELNFPAATILGGGSDGSSPLLSNGGLRLPQAQQFPLLGGSNPYPFEGSMESPGLTSQMRPKAPTSEFITQLASVKMEDRSNPEHNLSRQYLGIQGNDQFSTWNTNGAWTDLSGFSSSSTSNPQ
ncbi:hypothetical protein SAY87_026813 [Trapa incisa]|uniref:Dof zinc finger protein n=1 Tax=Trapa incisa TaxID=236973 RepID=A0AAN7JLB9_9MYRT|nr:hypothetical protein SAY87_026813 [Trapa incisa]